LETFANIAPIVRARGERFARIGTEKSKSKLIRELIAKGFSARKAEKVNAAFGSMRRALKSMNRLRRAARCRKRPPGLLSGRDRGHSGGTIQAECTNGRPRRKWQRTRTVNTGKIQFRMVEYPGEPG
jgi:hypothetical protein